MARSVSPKLSLQIIHIGHLKHYARNAALPGGPVSETLSWMTPYFFISLQKALSAAIPRNRAFACPEHVLTTIPHDVNRENDDD